MIDPKEIEIDGRNYILAKFPTVQGFEIVSQYPMAAMPKLGDYEKLKPIMFKLTAFVGVPMPSGAPLMLTTEDLINNHVPSWETWGKLQWAMMEYNCSFFQDGKISNFLEDTITKVRTWFTQTLTDLSRPS